MKQPFRREYPSTVAGLKAYYKAKDNWKKIQKEEKGKATKGKPFRRDFPSTVEGLRAYNTAKSNWNKTKNKNLKDLKIKNKLLNRVGNNVPNSEETSASIRATQKKNDKKVVSSSNNASSNNNSSTNNSSTNKNNQEKVVKNNKLKIKSTTKGGPVKDGVEYARSKGDDLAGYRRGEGTKLGKDTRITKKLKKAGFTEDRLARLRKEHAEWKKRKKKKNK